MAETTTEAPVGAWLSYRQAQAYCGLGRTTLTALVMSGEVQAAKVRKRVLLSRDSLDAYLESQNYLEQLKG